MRSLHSLLQREGMVFEKGLGKHLNLKEMGPVRGAVKTVAGFSVIDVDDPASVPLLCHPQSLMIFIHFGYSYHQGQLMRRSKS